MAVDKWPFDYDAMQKGDSIPSSKVIEVIQEKPDSPKFQLKLMRLVGAIERELNDRGKRVTVRSVKGAIEILDDPTAAEYAPSRRKKAVRQLMRSQEIAQRVDVSQLDEDQRRSHERSLLTGATYLQALSQAKRTLSAMASSRQTPKMIEK